MFLGLHIVKTIIKNIFCAINHCCIWLFLWLAFLFICVNIRICFQNHKIFFTPTCYHRYRMNSTTNRGIYISGIVGGNHILGKIRNIIIYFEITEKTVLPECLTKLAFLRKPCFQINLVQTSKFQNHQKERK